MKDLDFDELDRAVSTLMGNVTNTAEPAKQDDVKTINITATLGDNRPPVLPVGEAEQPRAESVVSVTPQPTVVTNESRPRPAPLAARRSGKFMDMVHPSATVRKPAPVQGVSRQGVSLSPIGTALDDSLATPDVAPVASVPETAATDTSQVSDWPDPLSLEPFDSEAVEQPLQEKSIDVSESESAEPLASPFLADAKVEKRPLGTPAPQSYTVPELEQELLDDLSTETPDAPVITEEAPRIELPAELQGDLMAIESDTSGAAEPVTAPPLALNQEPSEEEKLEQPKIAPAVASTAPATATLTAPVSIPQQYREEPSTGDQTTGSIYDTASYHQPLEHPAKKKTGWLWVIWVLVLLILGAGGGALAYLYLLQ